MHSIEPQYMMTSKQILNENRLYSYCFFGRPSHFCSHLRSSCISGLRDPPPLVKSINSEMAAIWAALMCCQSVSLPVCQCVSKCAIIKWSGQMQLWSITPYISPEEGEGSTVYANFIIALKLPVTSAQAAQLYPSLSLSPSALPFPFRFSFVSGHV